MEKERPNEMEMAAKKAQKRKAKKKDAQNESRLNTDDKPNLFYSLQ
jgi:hypothetical protein